MVKNFEVVFSNYQWQWQFMLIVITPPMHEKKIANLYSYLYMSINASNLWITIKKIQSKRDNSILARRSYALCGVYKIRFWDICFTGSRNFVHFPSPDATAFLELTITDCLSLVETFSIIDVIWGKFRWACTSYLIGHLNEPHELKWSQFYK